MFEIKQIPNWHGLPRRESSLRWLSVLTDVYRARWGEDNPYMLYIRGWNDESPDWVEMRIGGYCDLGDECHLPLQDTFRPDFDREESRLDTIHTSLPHDKSHKITFSAKSQCGKYTYAVIFCYDHVEFQISYQWDGSAHLSSVRYFGALRTRFDADTVFNSNPCAHGIQYTSLRTAIATGSNGDWWFSPAPFCFPMRLRDQSWMSVSVAPSLDSMDFTGFLTEPGIHDDLGFRLAYASLPEYTNSFDAPPLVLRFGASDPFDALRKYADGLVDKGLIEKPCRADANWWKGVMACGWHAQMGAENCKQSVYERHLQDLENAGIDWDILTIDDFWGKEHGIWRVDTEKWPDLRGFIERQHEVGRKVLLWVCINTDGLPNDELYCVGDMKLLDPLNPKYRQRLAENLHHMLGSGEGELNADGIKLDFTGRTPPSGRPSQCTQELHGMRYLYEVFRAIHDAAKAVKPDCLLDFQVANPHFAALHDMTRLNDYFLPVRMQVPVMETRSKIAQSVTFGALVDTDHPDSAEYFANSYRFGNISLYLTHGYLTKRFEELSVIRESIAKIKCINEENTK